ncbi:PspA/IM30 family protein [Pseudobacteroides cellulosolvens]|uniref:Phage shock protein A, PspA n=1 Tax=Pseudobacteroides cellulosolvens ATCC 35603 = DSM 2933 TaxID=398512 RepID=A0A0L6JWC5_9FIRM|nr:PspA/IM30 family protein [Pseudobacteroides cellulosolvens]KNY29712.1 phage shock protein A, PspA [Pseudobacteroides cellulosolvens ATCC 35603 = DSM 2933]
MGLFSRLGAMVRGFFGMFVGNMEERNPELLFEDIKNQVDKARKEAEQQIIEIQTNAELIKIEMKNSEKNLNAVKARVEAAQRQGDMDILVELLVQEEELQTTYETHKATYDNAMVEVARIREDFKIFESEMSVKLNELKTLKSQAKMATLRENINSVNAKYSSRNTRVGSINDSMDRAREIVNKKTARANAVESLNSDNTEMKIKRLDMNSARERAKARAEAMLAGDQGFEVKEKNENKTSN